MGLWDKLMGELVDVIEWTDSSDDTLVYRFERHGNEIKFGAMLTVRESQAAVFVNEGKIADVFQPGMYELETNNLPVLSTLQNWHHGFESPFKAEVYFFNLRRFVDMKWGTRNPLMLRDAEFGGVRLRAFGTYGIRVQDPALFMKEIVGTDGHYTTGEITSQLRNIMVARFSNVLGNNKIPILDLAASYDQLGEFVKEQITPEIQQYGLELTSFLVENISLPPEVEEALDKRTSMGIVGNLRDYVTYQSGAAMEAAAENPAGGASEGVGMGMGFAMAQQLGQQMTGQPASAPPSPPPPIPGGAYHIAVNKKPTGPFDMTALAAKATAGKLQSGTLVWATGMAGWQAAGDVAELQGLFAGNAPPPIPE